MFCEWLNELRAVSYPSNERKRVLNMNKYSGNALTENAKKALLDKNIELRFFRRMLPTKVKSLRIFILFRK